MQDDIRPPGLMLRMLEGRAGLEAGQLLLQLPILRLQATRGDGRRVLVLPGFMADDGSTLLLRRFLEDIGYQAFAWEQGVNRKPLLEVLSKLDERLRRLADDAPLSLVGWSRGGILARELARDNPDLVDRVITIGSPVKGGARVSSISTLVRQTTGMSATEMSALLRERQQVPITRPIRAIYSKSDGVVAWQACIDDVNSDVRHYEVSGSHSGMGANVEVFRLLPRLMAESIT